VIARLTRSFWVRALATAGVLVWLVTRIDLRETGAALARLDFRLAAVVGLLLAADRGVMIWRWLILLRARGTPISAGEAARIYLVSSFIGASTALAGDAARAYALSRKAARGSEAVASIGIDRLFGLLGILVIALVGVSATAAQGSDNPNSAVAGVTAVLIAGGASVLFADRWIRLALPRSLHETQPGTRALRLADAFGAYRGHRMALFLVGILSIAVQFLRILQAYLLGVAIGITVPFSYYLLFMPAGLIALMLPISIAGFGAPQGLIVWLLQPRGVPEAAALALSTLIVLSGIVANLPGAVLFLSAREAR
jgi:uncharacterized membrane protein YbhN (UPF0104 family)